MELTLLHFLIVCPLVFLGGFVDAVAGGGGLISLPAYLIAGVPPHMSIATNKLSSAMGTTLTTVRFAKKGFIPWKQAAVCVVFAFVGSSLGAKLALKIDARIFTMLMLVRIDEEKTGFRQLQDALDDLAKEMNLSIRIQKEEIFDVMHKI